MMKAEGRVELKYGGLKNGGDSGRGERGMAEATSVPNRNDYTGSRLRGSEKSMLFSSLC